MCCKSWQFDQESNGLAELGWLGNERAKDYQRIFSHWILGSDRGSSPKTPLPVAQATRMGLLAQALIVFSLAFGVCIWLLGRYFLSTSDMGVLREQLLASGETAALEEQQDAIAQARALALKPVLAPGSVPPAAPGAEPAAGAVAVGDNGAAPGRKKKKKKGEAAAEDYGPTAVPGTTPQQGEADRDDEDEDDDGVDETAEPFKEAKVEILKFLEGSLSAYVKDGFQLDAISKFGCHLFLAGAAEAIGRENELDNKEFIKILETSVS